VTSTRPDPATLAQERNGRLLRRIGLAAFTLFVVAGLAGLLGVRSTVSEGRDGDLHATLHHAQIARPALAIPYRLTIERDGGFDERIEVRLSTEYLQAFDENGRNPEPADTTVDGEDTIWEFDPPDGDTLVVWIDTRIEPGVQWRIAGSTTVVHGDEVLTIDHPLWILP
jgi:hypothetical protein